MDIFYKDEVNAGTLSVISLPKIRGQANLFFFNKPAMRGTTFVPGVIVTAVQYGQSTATQFQKSLDNTIYVYSFGDEMGNITVSGMAFPRTCNGQNGLREVLEFYRVNRVSRSVDSVRITFADETIEGFLMAMSMSTADAASGTHAFQLLIRSIPLAHQKRANTTGSQVASAAATQNTNAANGGDGVLLAIGGPEFTTAGGN